MENNNEKNLRRILGTHLKLSLKNPVHVEVLDTIISSVSANPLAFPALTSEYAKYFCDFCGCLHDLESCNAPSAADYRADPKGWALAHVPAIFRRQPQPARTGRNARTQVVVEQARPSGEGVPEHGGGGEVADREEAVSPETDHIDLANEEPDVLVCPHGEGSFRPEPTDLLLCNRCGYLKNSHYAL